MDAIRIQAEQPNNIQAKSFKIKTEKNRLNFNTNNVDYYNTEFTISELLSSIHNSPDSSTGPDNFHYQFLKHMPHEGLYALLDLFNNIWYGGEFPAVWREATVIPILKPGKDATCASSYRPIALTSCLCKVMERVVNSRLVYFLGPNELLCNVQCGFRQGRSKIDSLVLGDLDQRGHRQTRALCSRLL